MADKQIDLTANQPFQLIDVATGAETTVDIPAGSIATFAHTGWASGGGDAAAGSYVVMMLASDTMAANNNAGRKAVLKTPSGHIVVDGGLFNQVQLRAVTDSAKIQVNIVARK